MDQMIARCLSLSLILVWSGCVAWSGPTIVSAWLGGEDLKTDQSPVKIVNWTSHFSIPDDVLFVPHASASPMLFAVSLDDAGSVKDLSAISAFSYYVAPAYEQIKHSPFPADLAGTHFVLRTPDPLSESIHHPTGVLEHCTSGTDLRRLYELSVIQWNKSDKALAGQCYEDILRKNPSSLAARVGMVDVCWSRGDYACAKQYLGSLIKDQPEDVWALSRIASLRLKSDGASAYVAVLEQMLKLRMPFDMRGLYLDLEERSLEELGRIDEATHAIQAWNEVESELIMVVSPTSGGEWVTSLHHGLLMEGRRLNADALACYRLADRIASSDRMLPEALRYQIDLGLARTLEKTGHPLDSAALCERWRTNWKHLASHQVFIAPWDRRDDGTAEVKGRWEFSCGSPEVGLSLIEASAKKHPKADTPYRALAEYYYSVGDIEHARHAEETASRLYDEWRNRLGEF